MDNSLLAKFPPELRNRTFELVILVRRKIKVDLTAKPPALHEQSVAAVHDALSLMSTCKQIREECLLTFWSLNNFRVKTGMFSNDKYAVSPSTKTKRARFLKRVSRFRGWLQHLGSNAALLTHMRLDLGKWQVHVMDDEDQIEVELVAEAVKHLRDALWDLKCNPRFSLKLYWHPWGCDETAVVPRFSPQWPEESNKQMIEQAVRKAFKKADVRYDSERKRTEHLDDEKDAVVNFLRALDERTGLTDDEDWDPRSLYLAA
ncbi:hypothetical protein B0A50_03669 [Salinomyces thailandicus]|uniref:Uncharacterized protein n=1 Tax=Salinomyces thailandicus TaxID=706561 RepID=A0A4V5N794_9PEZI|nr:hypothetical protein B0A50_03669 [Salinomyces thailandica]